MHDLSVRPLSDIASLRGGYAFKSKDYTPLGAYSVLTIANVGAGAMIKSRANKIEVTDETPSWVILDVGDIVVTLTGNVGRVCKIDEDGWLLNQRVGRLIPKECDPEYLYQVVSDERFIREMELSASIGAQPNISNKSVLGYEFPCHPLREQKSVAAILSTWDRAIEATERLLENSKQRKKALMQQLLTGKKRLPGFEGEWVRAIIGDLCEITKGGGLSKASIQDGGTTPCVLYGELVMSYGAVIRKVKAATNVVHGLRIAKSGDVLIPTSAEDPEGLATASCIMMNDVAIGGDVLIVHPRSKQCYGPYLSYWLRQHRKAIMRLAAGASISHVYGKDIASIEVMTPSPEEQKVISELLEAAELELEALSSRVDALRREKKALMQQLLTGKKRVNVDKEAA